MMWTHVSRTAALSLLAVSLFAQTPGTTTPAPAEGRAGRGMHKMGRALEALNLTDAQKEQARAIFQGQREATRDVRDQMRQVSEQLRAAEEANDVARIQALSAQKGELEGRLRVAHADAQRRFKALLTPEQQTQLDQLQTRRSERRFRRG